MAFVTLDFETYYAKDFSLTRLTTEEYINDARFQVIGVGIKIDDGEPYWVTENIKEELEKINWAESAVLCHNMMFDGAILAFKYGIIPAYYFDTLCMARAVHGVDAGGSLATLAKRYELGEKGTEVIDALGKRREDFTAKDLSQYGNYCINDVSLTYSLFNRLIVGFPQSELDLIDMTLRMYTQPVFHVDDALLVERLEEVRQEKNTLLRGLMDYLEVGNEEEVRQKLASNPQFAALLKDSGVEPPMKISPTTGKETYALAKNDEGFITLTEHEDPIIQQLCSVRLGTKSTIEESRIERFIGIGARNKGRLPIPLKYYGAHTGRWAGSDSVNFQNLPSRDKKKKTLKKSVLAPPGHVVINCDSSQIEARVLAWLAGQDDVTEQFRKGEDVYSIFASKIYKKPISKANPVERFVGKTCISEGTLVLSDKGWKPIESVTTDDQLWDGDGWVCHQGLLYNGTKETLNLCGVWLTPDHQLWSGTQWLEAQSVVADEDILYRVLDTGAANLPSQAMWPVPDTASEVSLLNATAMVGSTPSINRILKTSNQLVAISALRRPLGKNGTGLTLKRCPTTGIEQDYLTVLQPQLVDATTLPTVFINTMGRGELVSAMNGGQTALVFCNTYKPLKDGITRLTRWIGQMWTVVTNRGTSVSYRAATISTIKEKSRTLKPVYDILNSGSKNRFTILTEAGPVIAHNCILGLGYGTGAKKLQHTLKTQPPGADLPEEECKRIVDLYRDSNHKITEFWRECDSSLQHISSWPHGLKPYTIGKHRVISIYKEGILLPNGLSIRYPDLRLSDKKYIYKSRKGVTGIWGGAMVENIVQAIARIIVGEQMLAIRERYRPVLTVHDAAVIVVEESQLNQAVAFITEVMSTPPAWATGLPVACETKYGQSYGDC